MRIYIPRILYDRVREYAQAQGLSVSRFVAEALKQPLGFEGMPLDEEDIWGGEKQEANETHH